MESHKRHIVLDDEEIERQQQQQSQSDTVSPPEMKRQCTERDATTLTTTPAVIRKRDGEQTCAHVQDGTATSPPQNMYGIHLQYVAPTTLHYTPLGAIQFEKEHSEMIHIKGRLRHAAVTHRGNNLPQLTLCIQMGM